MTKEEATSYWITHKLSFLRYHFGKGKKTLPWLNVVCCEHYVSRLRGECPGREWIREYEDKHCGSFDGDCSKCMLHHWCMTRDGSWYEWTHPWEFITIPVENWLENHMWDWYQKHPCKKI